MPADLFLKLGNVKGESVDLKHAGEMELLTARWGMQVAVAASSGCEQWRVGPGRPCGSKSASC